MHRSPANPHRWICPQSYHEQQANGISSGLLGVWASIRTRVEERSPRDEVCFPENAPSGWMALGISLDKDANILYITRHVSACNSPVVVSLPMDRAGRREGEEQQFDHQCAQDEMLDIVEHANSTSRRAKHVSSEEDKAAWWSERRTHDERLKLLLENIEHRWLGAFKVGRKLTQLPEAANSAL